MKTDVIVYRGYLIRFGLVGNCWIEKDGHRIATIANAHCAQNHAVDTAKEVIDELLD